MAGSSSGHQQTQQRMFKFSIWGALFVVLFGVAAYYFAKVFDDAEGAEARAAIRNYANAVVSIHQQWVLQGKPYKVSMTGVTAEGKAQGVYLFWMNQYGWPIHVVGKEKTSSCEALWFALQKADRLAFSGELVYLRPDQVVGIWDRLKKVRLQENRLNPRVCRNAIGGQYRFNYRFDNGKVELAL